jgi:hypothetical protein
MEIEILWQEEISVYVYDSPIAIVYFRVEGKQNFPLSDF